MTVSTPPTRNCVKGEFGVSHLSTPPNLILGVADFKGWITVPSDKGNKLNLRLDRGVMVVPRQSASSLLSLRANSPTRWVQCRSINILIP